jgi:hypothetical protein
MPMYQFKLVRADGTTESYLRLLAANDDEASERAADILASSQSVRVEVWQGLRLVFSAAKRLTVLHDTRQSAVHVQLAIFPRWKSALDTYRNETLSGFFQERPSSRKASVLAWPSHGFIPCRTNRHATNDDRSGGSRKPR